MHEAFKALQVYRSTNLQHSVKNEEEVRHKHAVADDDDIHLERFGVAFSTQVIHSIRHRSNPKGHRQVRVHVLPHLTCLVQDCLTNPTATPIFDMSAGTR